MAHFNIRVEHVADAGNITRSEKSLPESDLLADKNGTLISSEAMVLYAKVVQAAKEDGSIQPPSNVIKVDFKRRRRSN